MLLSCVRTVSRNYTRNTRQVSCLSSPKTLTNKWSAGSASTLEKRQNFSRSFTTEDSSVLEDFPVKPKKRYTTAGGITATALFMISATEKVEYQVLEDITAIELLRRGMDDEMREFVFKGDLDETSREEVFKMICDYIEANQTTRDFIHSMILQNSISDWGEMSTCYSELLMAQNNLVPVVVTSAKELEEKTLSDLTDQIRKSFLREEELPVIDNIIDPSILGGIKLMIGSEREWDGSFKTHLEEMYDNLVQALKGDYDHQMLELENVARREGHLLRAPPVAPAVPPKTWDLYHQFFFEPQSFLELFKGHGSPFTDVKSMDKAFDEPSNLLHSSVIELAKSDSISQNLKEKILQRL